VTATCSPIRTDAEMTAIIRDKIERAARNKLWVTNNIKALRARYPDKYVAYDRGEILAVAPDTDGIFRELKRKNVGDLSTVVVEFVPRTPVVLLR